MLVSLRHSCESRNPEKTISRQCHNFLRIYHQSIEYIKFQPLIKNLTNLRALFYNRFKSIIWQFVHSEEGQNNP